MRKVLLAFSIAAISFGSANAQDAGTGFHFAGGLRVALPIGDFADVSGFGIGAELQGENMFSETFSGLASVGYTNYSGKDYEVPGYGTVEGSSMGMIPIMAGVRFYPSTSFFVGAKAGVSIGTASGAGSNFTYEPQIGLNGEKFQVSLGYNAISGSGATLSSIGLSALYKFN
jgi:hypothetical protein